LHIYSAVEAIAFESQNLVLGHDEIMLDEEPEQTLYDLDEYEMADEFAIVNPDSRPIIDEEMESKSVIVQNSDLENPMANL
jgi:hypothetical protein